mgnify:CR=1 FL=1
MSKVEIVQNRLAELRAEKLAVQKKLYRAETGFRGWWNGTSLSRHQFQALTDDNEMLFKAIELHTAELSELLAPTKLSNALGRLSARLAILSIGGVALWSSWRYWSVLRMRFAPLARQQWRWRKTWLLVESPYPPAVKDVTFVSAAYLVYYCVEHPGELEQWGIGTQALPPASRFSE